MLFSELVKNVRHEKSVGNSSSFYTNEVKQAEKLLILDEIGHFIDFRINIAKYCLYLVNDRLQQLCLLLLLFFYKVNCSAFEMIFMAIYK